MSDKSVYAIVATRRQVEAIVDDLKSHGFANHSISVLFPDTSGTKDFAHEKSTKAPEGAVAGGVTGGVLGGTLGWIAGIGALAIPGLGPFIAAGPIAAALGGAAVGATAGGITGALVGMGVPEIEAKRYEGKVKDGGILVSVHATDGDEVSTAKEILEQHEAEDICTGGTESVDRSHAKDEDHSRDKRDVDHHPAQPVGMTPPISTGAASREPLTHPASGHVV